MSTASDYDPAAALLTTRVGDLDIHGSPRGTAGYDDLCAQAQSYDLGDGLVVLVSSVDDMIRMKKASGRAKDRAHLDLLRALKEQSTP
jgi:hypothetical protein